MLQRGRPLALFAAAASALMVAGAEPPPTPTALPEWVGLIPEVPTPIQNYLARRNAAVIESGRSDRPNVIRGQFRKEGQWDLAMLVAAPGKTEILVFWNVDSWTGSKESVSHLAPRPPLNRSTRLWRHISVIRADSPALDKPPPEGVPQGIMDESYEKGAVFHFWNNRRWVSFVLDGC